MTSNIYHDPPSLAELQTDPLVLSELDRAWQESNPFAPPVPLGESGSQKREQGGWILWNRTTGLLSVLRVPPGTRDDLEMVRLPSQMNDPDQVTVAWFHTHPNTLEEGYFPEPSLGDYVLTRLQFRVPGILETHEGRMIIPFPP